jgi:hypothetical protein
MARHTGARLHRIQRRAEQIADSLADELVAEDTGATHVVNQLSARLRWPSPEVALPALTQLWSRSLLDDSLVVARPAIKRSIITLLEPNYEGRGRAYGDIVGLMTQSRRQLGYEEEQFATGSTEEDQRLVLFHRGQYLQTAADAHALFRLQLGDRILAVSRILLGVAEPSSLGPEFPHPARVSSSARDFWVGLHLRLALPISIARFNAADPGTHLALLPRAFYLQTEVPIRDGRPVISYTSAEIRQGLAARLEWGAATGEAALTAFPLIPVGEDLWVTSAALLADSLAPFMLESVRQADQWEAAVGQPFEDEINEFFRSRDFTSGPVSAAGRWHPSGLGAEILGREVNRQLTSRPDLPRLAGQIDVLAIGPYGCIVVECKSVSAMIKIKNTFGRLSPDDAESWRSKLLAKVEWLHARLDRGVAWAAVIVEGVHYLNEAELKATVPVLPFEPLQSTIDSWQAKSRALGLER